MSALETYVIGWRESVHAIADLCGELSAEEWASPTDCPRWSVRDVVAHVAGVEAMLAGTWTAPVTVAATGGKVVSPDYTEAGVAALRDRSFEALEALLREAVARRETQLDPLPDDPTSLAPSTPADVSWSWTMLLQNRAIDVWVHEQDIRRATNRPGGLDSTGAQVTATSFAAAMAYVLGKRVAPAAGMQVVWEITGPSGFTVSLRVGEDGRGAEQQDTADADTRLAMDLETFTVLAAGRRTADQVDVDVSGDRFLAGRVLAAMAVTP